jgi:hypothetical protein
MVSVGNALNRTRRVFVFTFGIGLLLTIVALLGTTNAQATAHRQIDLTPTSSLLALALIRDLVD